MKNLTYREVMKEAVARKLTVTAEQRAARSALRPWVSQDASGGFGVVLFGGTLIGGCPTIDAAMTAGQCAELLGMS